MQIDIRRHQPSKIRRKKKRKIANSLGYKEEATISRRLTLQDIYFPINEIVIKAKQDYYIFAKKMKERKKKYI